MLEHSLFTTRVIHKSENHVWCVISVKKVADIPLILRSIGHPELRNLQTVCRSNSRFAYYVSRITPPNTCFGIAFMGMAQDQ